MTYRYPVSYQLICMLHLSISEICNLFRRTDKLIKLVLIKYGERQDMKFPFLYPTPNGIAIE